MLAFHCADALQYKRLDLAPQDIKPHIAEDCELRTKVHQHLNEESCLPCYPTDLETPSHHIPEEYEEMIGWKSLPRTERLVWLTQQCIAIAANQPICVHNTKCHNSQNQAREVGSDAIPKTAPRCYRQIRQRKHQSAFSQVQSEVSKKQHPKCPQGTSAMKEHLLSDGMDLEKNKP